MPGIVSQTMATEILILNGPNLNLLGSRQPDVYGSATLDDIIVDLQAQAGEAGVELRHVQSNSEGQLVDALHDCRLWAAGVVFNPGAYSHTSVALRDAIDAIDVPVVETHLSNVQAREEFRHQSLVTAVCLGVVAGFGGDSYRGALDLLIRHVAAGKQR